MTYGDYGRDTLIDPAPGGLGTYVFQVGHNEEEPVGGQRNLTVVTNTTGGIGLRQQGDDEPLTLTLSGTALHEHQHTTLTAFFRKSKLNTIIFRDFFGQEFEVIITSYKAKRNRTIRNPRDASINFHYYTWTLVLDVITVRNGPWVGA